MVFVIVLESRMLNEPVFTALGKTNSYYPFMNNEIVVVHKGALPYIFCFGYCEGNNDTSSCFRCFRGGYVVFRRQINGLSDFLRQITLTLVILC